MLPRGSSERQPAIRCCGVSPRISRPQYSRNQALNAHSAIKIAQKQSIISLAYRPSTLPGSPLALSLITRSNSEHQVAQPAFRAASTGITFIIGPKRFLTTLDRLAQEHACVLLNFRRQGFSRTCMGWFLAQTEAHPPMHASHPYGVLLPRPTCCGETLSESA